LHGGDNGEQMMAEPAGPKKSHVHPPHPLVPHPPDADAAKQPAAKKPAKPGSASGAVKWCREAPVAKSSTPAAVQDKPDGNNSVPAADLQDAAPIVAPHGSLTDSWIATNHAAPESDAPPKGSTPPGVYHRTQGEVRVEIKAGPVVIAPYAGYAFNLDPTNGAPAAESVERAGVKLQAGPASIRAEAAVRHHGSTPAAPVNFTDGDFVGEYNPSGRVGPAKMGLESSVLVRLSPDPTQRLALGSAEFVASETPGGVTLTQRGGVGAATFYDLTQKRNDLYLDIATLEIEKKVGPVALGADVSAKATFSTDSSHDRVVEIRGTLLKAKVEF
jgi:hypothetical protein